MERGGGDGTPTPTHRTRMRLPPRLQFEWVDARWGRMGRESEREHGWLAGWLGEWEVPGFQALVCSGRHRNQHELSQSTHHRRTESLGADIPTHLGTPASSETGFEAIHPRGRAIFDRGLSWAGPPSCSHCEQPTVNTVGPSRGQQWV